MSERQRPTSIVNRGRLAVAIALALFSLSASAEQASNRPNVVLITVDTLRADRLSTYGYERNTSPNMSTLAADGVRFTNAITPRSATAPSIASTLTGLYPYKHGVVTNFVHVDQSLWTIAEVLKGAGYETAAFVSNYVLIRELSKMDQGFDLYDDFVVEREPNRAVYERKASETVDAALSWLQKRTEAPFFLWLHLMDPHGPYIPPKPYATQCGPGPAKALPERLIPHYQRRDSTNAAFYLDQYDGEIAYTDAQIGRLLGELRERNNYDDSLVILHADHGEALGEHDVWFEHGSFVYEDCNRIPLLLKFPKSASPEDRRVAVPPTSDRLVTVMDIAPTIYDVLGITSPVEPDGESLRSVLKNGRKGESYFFVDTIGMPRPEIYVGLRSHDSKLIRRVYRERKRPAKAGEFYLLNDDPLEKTNLFDPSDPRQREMRERLSAWMKRINQYKLPFELERWKPPDGDAFIRKRGQSAHVEELRALGYIE